MLGHIGGNELRRREPAERIDRRKPSQWYSKGGLRQAKRMPMLVLSTQLICPCPGQGNRPACVRHESCFRCPLCGKPEDAGLFPPTIAHVGQTANFLPRRISAC